MAWFKSSKGEVNTYSWSIEESINIRNAILLVYILALMFFMLLSSLY